MKALLILLLLPLQILAQDLSGVWTGTLYNDSTKKFLPYEITINDDGGKLTGYSHITFKPDVVDAIVNIGVKEIKIKRKKDKLYIEDEKWLYNNFPEPPPKNVKQYSLLTIQTGDSGLILSGPFNTNPTKDYAPVVGSIRLQRTSNFATTKIIPKLEEMNLLNTLTFLPPKVKEKEITAVVNTPVEKPVLPNSTTSAIQTSKPEEKNEIKVPAVEKSSDPDMPKTKEVIPETTVAKKEIRLVKKEPVVVAKVDTKPQQLPVQQPPQQKQIIATNQQKVVAKPPIVQPPVQKPVTATVVQKPVVKAAPPPVKQEVAKVNPPAPKQNVVANITPVSAAELATRKIETIRSVNVKSDSLVINLYDNGEIDGDTVSVILNGKTIMSRQGLTANAITKTIYLTPDLGDSIQLIMYAENLGSIPPNTGLLILQDGNDRYEIRFAGDLQKNSAVILRRRH